MKHRWSKAMLNIRQLALLISVFFILLLNGDLQAKANNEVFYACESGYQFETKKKAARCIKQQRLTFRSPESCANNNSVKFNYVLAIDKLGHQDRCIVNLSGDSRVDPQNKIASSSNNKTPDRSAREPTHKSFIPQCQKGYKLQIKRGKDTCNKQNQEVILAPNKKVSR